MSTAKSTKVAGVEGGNVRAAAKEERTYRGAIIEAARDVCVCMGGEYSRLGMSGAGRQSFIRAVGQSTLSVLCVLVKEQTDRQTG